MQPRSADMSSEEAEAKYALMPDPAVRSSLALSSEPGPGLGALSGLRDSARISNQVSVGPKTVRKKSFLPPSIDGSRRCSTGMKTKEAAADIQQPGQEAKAKHAFLHDPAVRPSLALSLEQGPGLDQITKEKIY